MSTDPEQLFNLTGYGGNLADVITKGGIPFADLNTILHPNRTTDKDKGFNVQGSQFAARNAQAPRNVIYGRARVGGVVTFLTTDQGASGNFLHLFVTLAGHEIDAVEKLYLDDREVIFGGGGFFPDPRWGAAGTIWQDLVFMGVSTGADDQAANPDLVSQSAALFPGLWTVNHRQRGCAGAYLILVFSETLYPSGIPTIQFLVRGRKVYDPRTGLTQWTDNAPLCLADYVAQPRFGFGAGYGGPRGVSITPLIESANLADESIGLNGGGTEKRYTLNGSFDTSRSPKDVLTSMQACIAGGPITPIQGLWNIRAAKYRAPVMGLTADDVVSGLRVQAKQSRRDTFNGVKGTFISPENGYQPFDFPAQTSSFYVAQDSGIENFADVTFELVTSSATAQRNSKIALEDGRQPILVTGNFKLKCLRLIPADTVRFTFDAYGWDEKEFRVLTCRLETDQDGARSVSLTLKETAAGVYDWNDGEETLIDLAPDTYLPDPANVQPLTGLTVQSGTAQLIRNGDGTIITRARLDWNTPADPFAYQTEIEYKRSDDPDWQANPTVAASTTHTFVVSLEDGASYDFRVRTVNASGFVSSWITVLAHVVVGKTAPPSDVVNFRATLTLFGITLTWDPVTDIDLSHYEIRIGDSLSSWSTATFLDETRATTLKVDVKTAGTYKFFIRARDTSKNYSFLPAGDTVTIPGPDAPQVLASISGPNLVLDWEAVGTFFAIDHYAIRYGATFGSSTLLVETSATVYQTHVDFGGERRFYITAVDIAGNESTPFVVDVAIASPSAPQNLMPETIDNFGQLRWSEPATHTLPIDHYTVYRGDDFETADLIGEVAGTFFTRFEPASGTFRYWVEPVDSAGNAGTPASMTVVINEPPDYVLQDDRLITSWDTYDHTFLEGADVVGPVILTETYAQHFTNNSWTTPQDQIDDGYPIFIQPGGTDGYVEKTIDYGTTLSSSVIHLSWNFELIDGALTIEPRISYSPDNSSWTDVDEADVKALSFRYVKIRLTFNGTTAESIGRVSNVRLKLDVKTETDQGVATLNSGDVGGTTINFNLDFISVSTITLTANSTSAAFVTYDFNGATPNPTSFKAFAWDAAGARLTRDVSWTARGIRRT